MDQKFCYKCGNIVDVNAAFCPNCGEKFNVQSAPEPTPIQQYNANIPTKKSLKDKIDIKKTILSNVIPVACLAVGIILLIYGMSLGSPSDYISSYGMHEYVGGDAYNYIIEACLRGGKIAAGRTNRCIYICSGLLISCMAALKINVVKPAKEND